MIPIEWIISYLALGALVGFMAGLLGIGGGGIMVPILTSFFITQGIPTDHAVHIALGTSMASIVTTSIASLRAHNQRGGVLWDVLKSMLPGILLGTFIATFVASELKSEHLAIIFSLFMAYVSIQMFLNKKPKPGKAPLGKKGFFFAGSGIGAISALVSIGGGSLTVPFLVWQNIDIKKAIGTSAAIGLPISLAGTIGYMINGLNIEAEQAYSIGYVNLIAVALISFTSFFLAPVGARFAHTLPTDKLKKIFGILLVSLSIKMLFSVL